MVSSIKRWTRQLKTIVDIVYLSNVHLTADEIYLEARKTLPNTVWARCTEILTS
jgi:Fur family ferric uptake transcriptional regulator/Fur family peroxide stress response transcriptional regulator